jgi:hypothetical protein
LCLSVRFSPIALCVLSEVVPMQWSGRGAAGEQCSCCQATRNTYVAKPPQNMKTDGPTSRSKFDFSLQSSRNGTAAAAPTCMCRARVCERRLRACRGPGMSQAQGGPFSCSVYDAMVFSKGRLYIY